MRTLTTCFWLLVVQFASAAASGAGSSSPGDRRTEIINVGSPMKRFDRLKPGTYLYLRYKIGKDGSRSTMDIWRRTVSFERRDDQDLLHISQRWDGVVPPAYTVLQESWFERGTFRPLTHDRDVTRKRDEHAVAGTCIQFRNRHGTISDFASRARLFRKLKFL